MKPTTKQAELFKLCPAAFEAGAEFQRNLTEATQSGHSGQFLAEATTLGLPTTSAPETQTELAKRLVASWGKPEAEGDFGDRVVAALEAEMAEVME